MTEFCLVRHGQTDWNYREIVQGREDIPLNETGKRQAAESAAFLKDEKWDMIISSPLVRAFETAKVIGEAVGIGDILLDERFLERDFGEISGKGVSLFRERALQGEIQGMEQDKELVARCFDALGDVARQHGDKRIIIVAHAHTIKAILHAIAPEEIDFKTPLQNACANYVTFIDDAWHVVQYNVSDHIS